MAHVTAPDITIALRDKIAKRKVVNRLRRAHGQLAACSKAFDRAGFLVTFSALDLCQ